MNTKVRTATITGKDLAAMFSRDLHTLLAANLGQLHLFCHGNVIYFQGKALPQSLLELIAVHVNSAGQFDKLEYYCQAGTPSEDAIDCSPLLLALEVGADVQQLLIRDKSIQIRLRNGASSDWLAFSLGSPECCKSLHLFQNGTRKMPQPL